VIKSRKLKLPRHVECTGKKANSHGVWWGRPEGRSPLDMYFFILKNINTRKPTYKFATFVFIGFLPYIGFHSKSTLECTVIHIYEEE
jgi:hypothetical protein